MNAKQPPEQKVALITGGARRIGAEIARQLHAQGYKIALHYRSSAEPAQILCKQLNEQRSQSAASLQADLVEKGAAKDLAQAALKLWGRVDLLVNNASSFYPTPLEQASEEQWQDLMGSNLKAPYFLSQALAQSLTEHQGAIINIADVYAERPKAEHSIYCIAKAGNLMLTKSLALDLAPAVRVNSVAPGSALWPEKNGEEIENHEALKQIPLQSLGGAEAIAQAVVFLSQHNYITGQILQVDGGKSLIQI